MKLSMMLPEGCLAFANDAADVVRVFFGSLEMLINTPGGDMTLLVSESTQDDLRTLQVQCGEHASVHTAPVCTDAL